MDEASLDAGAPLAAGRPAGLLRDPSSHVDTLLALTELVNEEPDAALRQIAGELRDLTDSRLSAIYLVDDGHLVPLVVNERGQPLLEAGLHATPVKDAPAAGAVLDAGLPLALESYGRPVFRHGAGEAEVDDYESALLLPLLGRGEGIGLVELCDSAARDYAAERGIAERLVKVAAGAVLVIGDRRRLRARERVADELVALGDAVARAHSLTELVRPVAESLFTAVGADDCDVWHLHGEMITCLASVDRRGFDESVVGTEYHLADYPTYVQAMAAGVPRVIASRNDPRLSAVELAALEKWGFNSNLCVPLVVEDRRLGFIDIYDSRERDYCRAPRLHRAASAACSPEPSSGP